MYIGNGWFEFERKDRKKRTRGQKETGKEKYKNKVNTYGISTNTSNEVNFNYLANH